MFKPNDKVKVIDPKAAGFGETGTVAMVSNAASGSIGVMLPAREFAVHYDAKQLEKV